MKLELKEYGLTKYNKSLWIGFSKCGPSYNKSKFYRNDTGDIVGYEEDLALFGSGLCFTII